ncbi:hypothetical protein ES692_05975 [Psychroserpens burtonensis]|uniref:Uncharacterized protein n=1 Tax=Psychroserpens burtonensis TaxID=49278 RepID=A0A5C7B8Z1_9FLAO|nr:hypothetical protein [Psychroserpens burtonensis]TXE18588.1 hypothetical protein ES692_05975 [Psychroserpens burtonensis]
MITKTDKKILKIHLKNDYVKDVLKNLLNKGVVSRNNQAYSQSMIRSVFNGITTNDEIETAMLEEYAIRKQVFEIKESAKNKILSS